MEKSLDEIDAIRARLGIAQADLCRVADVSESTLSRNKRLNREPTPRIRRKLVKALETIAEERGIALVDRPESDQ